ncbi:hypothetical protein WJX79_003311 [Trebouxia sp. C0005]
MRLVKGILQHRSQLFTSRARTFAALVDGQGTPTGAPKQGAYEKVGVLHEQDMLQRELPESPDALQDAGQGAGKSITEEELTQRKSSAVRAWMEGQVGRDKVQVAQILKDHNVLVRGGPEQGSKLMEALVAWKNQGSL